MWNNISLVMFDLDGVLVDACEWHYESLNLALLDFGLTPISREDHILKFNGLPTKIKLNMLGVSKELSTLINRKKQDKTLEIIRASVTIDQKKIELLSYLKSKEIRVACVTNSIKETATEMLIATGQLPYVDLLVTNEDVIKNKPHPDCYNFAIRRMGVDSKKCICVEDSPKGIQAARQSKAKYVWEVANATEVCLSNFLKYLEKESLL